MVYHGLTDWQSDEEDVIRDDASDHMDVITTKIQTRKDRIKELQEQLGE